MRNLENIAYLVLGIFIGVTLLSVTAMNTPRMAKELHTLKIDAVQLGYAKYTKEKFEWVLTPNKHYLRFLQNNLRKEKDE